MTSDNLLSIQTIFEKMYTEEQNKQFLELINLLFEKSKYRYSFTNKQVFDKFLSNLYSRYYPLFHPSKYLSLKRLKKILKNTNDINSEELKLSKVELDHQSKLLSRNKGERHSNSPIGIEEEFALKTKIIGWKISHGYVVDWEELSKYHMFFTDIEVIRKYKDKLTWEILVCGPQLPWSMEFITEFEKFLFIDSKYQGYKIRSIFSHVKCAPWSEELIDKYVDCWDWNGLSGNTGIKWSEDIIIKYANKWDWKVLSTNPSIIMTEKLLLLFYDKWWYWEILGSNPNIKWTYNLIQKVKWITFWEGLSHNPSLKWGLNLIKRFEKHWNWEILSKSDLIPWTEDLIFTFIDKWHWFYLSSNPSINWNRTLIDKFKSKINWYSLSGNPSLKVIDDDIQFYKDLWRWDELCQNESIGIDRKFLSKYKKHINFQGHINWGGGGKDHYFVPEFLMNKNLNLKIDYIRNLSNQNQWEKGYVYCNQNPDEPGEWIYFSKNKNLTLSILKEFSESLDWDVLSSNKYLPWDMNLVLQFKDLWNWEILIDNEIFWSEIIEPNLKIMNIKYINEMFEAVYLTDWFNDSY